MAEETANVTNTAAEGNNNAQQSNTTTTQEQTTEQNQTPISTETLDKLIQSRVDKITAGLGKENYTLKKELEELRKAKLTDEQIKELEIKEKENAIAEKEKALLERENRLFAIKAIKENGLDDGSDTALEIVNFVMGENEETIKNRVTAFKSLVDKIVAAKVDATFKANGRTPNNGNRNEADAKKTNTVAESLGKQRAEQLQKAQSVLNHYLGGK